jgi:hypothetical protein
MTAFQWLEQNGPGFSHLSAAERDAISQFSLLWSLFEKEVLGGHGSVGAIEDAAGEWHTKGLLTAQTFAGELAYFRGRYYANGDFTYRFSHLHLEKSGNPQIVPNVLSGKSDDPRTVAAAVLIIVFRYRNNFFHGEKWVYELREQDQNFAHANAILIRAIELNRAAPKAPVI